MHPQVLPPLGAAEGEQIIPRGQEAQIHLLRCQQAVGLFPVSGMAHQPHPAPGTASAAEYPQGAQGVLPCKAQVLFCLFLIPQTERNSRPQCSGY